MNTTDPETFEDIKYTERNGVATITINRPDVLNAFRARTVDELLVAVTKAGWDPEVGVVVLTGTGDRAFCVGGDQSTQEGGYGGGRGAVGLPIEELHSLIRDIPKPVIAKVNGYAVGGGNVLATICDLTIASDKAEFGQVGPKVGSVDPGWGTALLARHVGEKRAKEFWFMCRRYTATEAQAMGLVNRVVPHDELDSEVDRWCEELMARSPTAITIAKRSINADSESIRGIGSMGFQTLALYYNSDESKEGVDAFLNKRKPDFRGVLRRSRQ
jgi:2-ketocyclohexanecarboxyl-CoA hydrolase